MNAGTVSPPSADVKFFKQTLDSIRIFSYGGAPPQPETTSPAPAARYAERSFAELLSTAAHAPAATAPAASARPTKATEPDRSTRAANFLTSIAGGGLIAVAAIVPDVGLSGRTFHTGQEYAELRAWLQDRNGHANLYYSLNEPKPAGEQTGGAGKLNENDVARIRGVAIDVDPDKKIEAAGGFNRERERLMGLAAHWPAHFLAPASIVVDSGGGVQIIWLFAQPLPNDLDTRAKVKAQARGMNKLLGSDAVQSVDHLLRIPFTINLPNEAKRLRGRTQTEAKLLHFKPAVTSSLETLATVANPIAEAPAAPVDMDGFDYQAVIAAVEGEPLPAHLEPVADAIRSSKAFATAMTNGDKSGRDFAVTRLVIERGLSDPTEIGVIAFSLSSQRLLEDEDKGRGAYYALRTIRSALAEGRPQDWHTEVPASAPSPAEPATSAPAQLDIRIVSGLSNPKSIEFIDWVIEPQVAAGNVTLCVGREGTSKSTLAIRTAVALATGREDILRGQDANGHPVGPERIYETGAVLVIDMEDSTNDMERRKRALELHHKLTADDFEHDIILLSGQHCADQFKFAVRRDPRGPLVPGRGVELVKRLVREHAIKTVIVGPLIALSEGADENSPDMRAVMNVLIGLAESLHIGLLVQHHSGKGADKAGTKDAARGASDIMASVRIAFTTADVTGGRDDERAFGAREDEHLIRLDYVKGNHLPPGRNTIFLRRVPVRVGNNTKPMPQGGVDLAALSPKERRAIFGEEAPALEVVDVRARKASAKVEAGSKEQAEAKEIANMVCDLVGDRDQVKLSDIRDALGERMRNARLCETTDRKWLTTHITTALVAGVKVERDGQIVRVKAEQIGNGIKAPWCVTRTVRNTLNIQTAGVA